MFFNKLPVDVQKSMMEKMEGQPSVDIIALDKRFEKIMVGDVSDPHNAPSDMDLIRRECTSINDKGEEVFDTSRFELFKHVFQRGFSEAVFAEDNSEIIKTFTFEGAKTYVSEQTT